MHFAYPIFQVLYLLFVGNCQRYTLVVVSSSSAHSMQVNIQINRALLFSEFRCPNIDDEASVPDIYSPGNDIRTQQNVGLIISELDDDVLLLCDCHVHFFAIRVFLACNNASFEPLQVLAFLSGKI